VFVLYAIVTPGGGALATQLPRPVRQAASLSLRRRLVVIRILVLLRPR
jgi:hypothetical protein